MILHHLTSSTCLRESNPRCTATWTEDSGGTNLGVEGPVSPMAMKQNEGICCTFGCFVCCVSCSQWYYCDTDDDDGNDNGEEEGEDEDDNGDNDDDDDSANDDDDSANGDDEGHKHVRVPGTRRVKTSRRDAFAFASGKDCSLSLSVVFTQSMQKMLW